MLIVVTEQDISLGFRGSSTQCPVARAIRREINCTRASVSQSCIIIDGIEQSSPSQVSHFIRKFDTGDFVRPFEFELKI